MDTKFGGKEFNPLISHFISKFGLKFLRIIRMHEKNWCIKPTGLIPAHKKKNWILEIGSKIHCGSQPGLQVHKSDKFVHIMTQSSVNPISKE